MVREGVLVGGRYDGAKLSPATRADFLFVAGSEKSPRAFGVPGTNRFLYRRFGRTSKADLFLCAEHTYRQCSECEGFTPRAGACSLCGAEIAA